MDRRTFLAGTGAVLLAAPLAAEAQQAKKVWRIGVLAGSPPTTPEASRPWEALMQGLRELGYVEGQNLAVERRWAEGRADRYHELAAELVAWKPDVIVAAYTPSVTAVKRATSTIPIVAFSGDPVGAGLVASLARPGGNITGVSVQNSPELAGKRLELLKEAFPSVSRVGFLVNGRLPHRKVLWQDLERTALVIGLKLQPFEVSGPEDFSGGGLTAKQTEAFGALVVHPDPLAFTHRREIAEFGLSKKIPVMAGYGFAEAGCLLSYDAYYPDLFRRMATYVDKILKGAKPADLPIEQPTTFRLIINLKTAKTIGLTVPTALLQRADEIIQ